MTTYTISEIKSELREQDPDRLLEICLRLSKYKKENKELVSYLLFQSNDEREYIGEIEKDIDVAFEELPQGHVYYIKKTLRKILRMVNRQVRYSAQVRTEIEVRIYFCGKVTEHHVPLDKSPVLKNLFTQQVKKIESLIKKLPEDEQADFEGAFEKIRGRA